MKAAIQMDMHGCPNRCKHCWLGHSRNPNVPIEEFIKVAEQFRNYTRNGEPFFEELICTTWYREPDFPDNYRELWELENRLSTGKTSRFELASIWRLARDPDYAPWLRELGVEIVQITMYGTEKNTDYFTGRKGAYRDILKAFDVLLENGVTPRVQVFPFTTTLDDIRRLMEVLKETRLEERVNDLGRNFTCFFNTFTPMGEGYNLLDIALRKDDIEKLPGCLVEKTLEHRKKETVNSFLKTEAELLPELMEDDNPLNDDPKITAFSIDSDFNVYPNCGEPTGWWRLGNLKEDGVEKVIETFLNRNTPGLRMNYETPVRYFARKYGNPESDILWAKSDLVHKWIRTEGMASL